MTDADIIVLGGGLAGCCAALGALQAGAKVLMLEKARSGEGSTWQSAGTFAFAGTDLQRESGIEDEPARIGKDLMAVGGGHCDPAMIDRFVEAQLDTYRWLADNGVVFERVQPSGGQGVPRSHATDPAQLMSALEERLEGFDNFSRVDGAAASSLERQGEGWRVILADGREFSVPAVVIASGGFSRSQEMVQTFAPELNAGTPLGGFANTGDGLRMAMAVGCGLADMGYVKGTFGMPLENWPQPSLTPPEGFFLLMAIYRGGIAVNLEGNRFTDESRSYKEIGTACLAQPRGVAIQIFDSKTMAQAAKVPTNMNFAEALERGIVRKGATLSELAQTVGIDSDALEQTVYRYNSFVADGNDADHGRTSIVGGVGELAAIDAAPFYAIPCGVAVTGTFCGIKVDADACVLDPYGAIIPGLYAAGEVVGGFHGESYMSGSALAKAAVFGRIAGRHAGKANAPARGETASAGAV